MRQGSESEEQTNLRGILSHKRWLMDYYDLADKNMDENGKAMQLL